MSRTLLQQALDALTNCLSEHGHRCNRCDSEIDEGGKLIAALREALAAPEPEPVAEVYRARYGRRARNVGVDDVRKLNGVALPPLGTKLYAAPPAAPDHLRDVAEKAAPAASVVREPQPEPVQRLMRFAGKKRSEVSNPCLTAREAIVIADWMQAHGIGTTGGGNG